MTQSTTTAGLAGIATPNDTFAIIAMDQRNTLKRMYAAVGAPRTGRRRGLLGGATGD